MENYEELSLNGYVKLHRSTIQKGWYKKSEHVHLWVHLMLLAEFANRETWFNGQPIKLKPGQFVTGRKKLSADTGINESKIERILKCFEIEQQIEQLKTPTSRLVTISNWSKYQQIEQPFEQRLNNGRTTDEHYIKKVKNIKNIESSEANSSPSPIKKTLLDKQKETAVRQKQFYESLIPFVEQYGKKMLREFYDYWSEPNKARTKFKMEYQTTWDLARRLAKWEENQQKFSKNGHEKDEHNPTNEKLKYAGNGSH